VKQFVVNSLTFLFVAMAGLGIVYQKRIERVMVVNSMFSGAEQYHNFNRINELTHFSTMSASKTPYRFPEGRAVTLPADFTFEGVTLPTEQFLSDTDTSALLILKNGELVYENYWLTGGPDVRWMSWSLAKSYVSALIGIAVEEGHIRSIEDAVTDYVPMLKGTGYDGVRIKDVLQMSSGARWVEDYSDMDSDIMRWAVIFALGGSTDKFLTTLTRETEPGTFNRYSSADTQVLGLLLIKATGRTLTDYMQEKLWHPLGSEYDADWVHDSEGREIAAWGLNVTARDFAKLGELYRRKGRWGDRQLVPADWVDASVTPDAPHLMPGDNPQSNRVLGYGYQWWLPAGQSDYTAIGVYNQFIYVNPDNGVVIVKLSANSDYGMTHTEKAYRELESIEFFRQVTASISREAPNVLETPKIPLMALEPLAPTRKISASRYKPPESD